MAHDIDASTGQCSCCGDIVPGTVCEQCVTCDGLSYRSRVEHHELHAGPACLALDGPRYDRGELAKAENE